MSHFPVVVIVLDAATRESAIKTAEHLLAPFDENTRVEPYPHTLDSFDIDGMRRAYQVADAPLIALVPHIEDWTGHPGGYDAATDTLYDLTTYNPRSKHDWYEIGGRWDGEMGEGNITPLREAMTTSAWPPLAVILPTGEWVERGRMGWFGVVSNEQPRDEWAARLERLLAPYLDDPSAVAVLVDCHI